MGCRIREIPTARNGFTLIELILVISIMAILMALAGSQVGVFSYWKEEGFIRRLSEIISFLHNQAVSDQVFYRLQFDLETNSYRIQVMRPEDANISNSVVAGSNSADMGTLSLELASFLSPAIGETYTLIPPPSFPSLAQPVTAPDGMIIEDIRTMRGTVTVSEDRYPFVLFSPRGFSEFAVIHLKQSAGAPITILINPFSGNCDIYREYRDFEWSYSERNKQQ